MRVRILRAQSELLRHGLGHNGARAGADVLGAEIATTEPSPRIRTSQVVPPMNDVDPLRLRHTEPRLTGPRSASARPALRPAGALGADAPLGLAGARVVASRSYRSSRAAPAGPCRAREPTRRAPARARICPAPAPARGTRRRAGIDEHVVVLGADVRNRIHRRCDRSRLPLPQPRRPCRSSRLSAVSEPSRFAPSFTRWMLLGRLPTLTCSSRRSSTGAPARVPCATDG